MSRLEGKVAIITGASQGMGESHARTFVREGAKVVLTDINTDRGQQIARELGARLPMARGPPNERWGSGDC